MGEQDNSSAPRQLHHVHQTGNQSASTAKYPVTLPLIVADLPQITSTLAVVDHPSTETIALRSSPIDIISFPETQLVSHLLHLPDAPLPFEKLHLSETSHHHAIAPSHHVTTCLLAVAVIRLTFVAADQSPLFSLVKKTITHLA